MRVEFYCGIEDENWGALGPGNGLTWDGAREGGKEKAKEKKAIWFGGGKGGEKFMGGVCSFNWKISLRNNKCFGRLFSEQKRVFFLFLLKSAVKTDEAMLILKSKAMSKRHASSAFNYACTIFFFFSSF